jgi:hypothetical protein
MAKWLSTWGTLIIAVIALIQPWARAAYRRYLRQGTVQVFETGQIEISFGGLGAGISLLGTLLAKDRDFFIRRMRLQLVRLKDSAKREFEWGAFRPFQIPVGGSHTEIEMPAGFMLLTSDPRKYNAFFVDTALSDELSPLLVSLREAWNERWEPVGLDLAVRTSGGTPSDEFLELVKNAHLRASGEFAHQEIYLDAQVAVDRMCYWEPGSYELTLSVEVPDKIFSTTWHFSLSDDDTRGLRSNVGQILSDALGWESPAGLFAALTKYLA